MPTIDREPCGVEVPVAGGGLYIFEMAPYPNGVRRLYSPATRDFSVWLTDSAIAHRKAEDKTSKGAIAVNIALRKARGKERFGERMG